MHWKTESVIYALKMLNIVLYIVLTVITSTLCDQEDTRKYSLELVKDILSALDKSYYITSFLCNKPESLRFRKVLWESGYLVCVLDPSIESLPYPHIPNRGLFIGDVSCNKLVNTIFKADKLDLFAAPFHWILIEDKPDENLTNTYFTKIKILVDSEVIVAKMHSQTRATVIKVYKLEADLPLVKYNVGSWTLNSGYIPNDILPLTARRRTNLNQTVLRTSVVFPRHGSLNYPIDEGIKDDFNYSEMYSFTKINYATLQHLGDIVNVKLKVSLQPSYGTLINNGTKWIGIVGELDRNDADIGGSPTFMRTDRLQAVDFIPVTTPLRLRFVFRKPKLSFVANVYVLPFDWGVWTCLFLLITITIVILYVVTNLEGKMNSSDLGIMNQYQKVELQSSWLEIVTLAIGALCQQGTSSVPYNIPGRILTISLLISLMFLYTCYSANIVALLQSSSNNIRTLDELLHSPLDAGAENADYSVIHLKSATEPIKRALYLQKIAPQGQTPNLFSMEDGVEKIRKDHFAFHMDIGQGYKYVGKMFEEHEKCDLEEITFVNYADPMFPIRKHSPMKEVLKIGLFKIQESGLHSREVWTHYTKKPHCMGRTSTFISVGIIDCYLAAAIYLGGVLISLCILLLELYANYRMKNFVTAFISVRCNFRLGVIFVLVCLYKDAKTHFAVNVGGVACFPLGAASLLTSDYQC